MNFLWPYSSVPTSVWCLIRAQGCVLGPQCGAHGRQPISCSQHWCFCLPCPLISSLKSILKKKRNPGCKIRITEFLAAISVVLVLSRFKKALLSNTRQGFVSFSHMKKNEVKRCWCLLAYVRTAAISDFKIASYSPQSRIARVVGRPHLYGNFLRMEFWFKYELSLFF